MLDFERGGDFFRFKSGGDGEHLMYLLDMYFEEQDATWFSAKINLGKYRFRNFT